MHTGDAVLERVLACLGPGADAALARASLTAARLQARLRDRYPVAWGGSGDLTGDETTNPYFAQATRQRGREA